MSFAQTVLIIQGKRESKRKLAWKKNSYFNDLDKLNNDPIHGVMVARERFELSSAGPKPAMLPLSLNWREFKAEFVKYLQSKHYNPLYFKAIISNLERHVKSPIRRPMDIIAIYSNLSNGQQHNLNRALSALFKFYELKGEVPLDFLNSLRKVLPRDNIGVDLKVPTEQEILNSLKKLNSIPLKYQALYNLLVDSGLRLTEAVKAINEFSPPFKVKSKNYYRLTLGYFRASKIAYCAYFSDYTYSLIRAIKEPIKECGARRYYSKYGFTTPRYIRKFAFDNMIRLEIPESIADFIQGRAPKRIGAKHYMVMVRQADRYYKRYADYIGSLRERVSPP